MMKLTWICSVVLQAFVVSSAPHHTRSVSSSHLAIRLVNISESPSASHVNLTVAPFGHMPLRRTPRQTSAQRLLQSMRNAINDAGQFDVTTNSTKISFWKSNQYVGSIQLGGKDFQVIIDSGSSDTWIIKQGYSCLDYDGKKLPAANCPFGPAFSGSPQYGTIPGSTFSLLYGDGERLQGSAILQDVTIAGITVKKQEIALVDQVYTSGDGYTSGLLGLAYPFLTSAFNVSKPVDRNPGAPGHIEYDPIFTSMCKQDLINPQLFSMAMDRNDSGWLTFGGLPPVNYLSNIASTPIRMMEVYNVSSLLTHYSFYTIVADRYIFGTKTSTKLTVEPGAWSSLFSATNDTTQFPIVVDSGSTLVVVPSALADAYAKQFKPAAEYNAFTGEYWAPCSAKPPPFGVVIGGQTFYLNDRDLLIQSRTLDWNGDGHLYCMVGVADGYQGPYILGDTFLNSVVAVYDVGAGYMRFASRA